MPSDSIDSSSPNDMTNIIKQLRALGTCEISDALIKLKSPSGGLLPGVYAHSPKDGAADVCGPAFTVEMVSQEDTAAPKPEKHFVDATEGHAGSIMVISAPHETRSAIWGGLMTVRAQATGIQGVVLSGRCRDLQEQWDAAFPIYARSHSTLGQSPFTRPSRLQVPLTIHDPTTLHDASPFPPTSVHPGDIVRGDVDGVVVCPQELAQRVIDLATKSREVDAKCRQDLLAGEGVKATFAKWRGK